MPNNALNEALLSNDEPVSVKDFSNGLGDFSPRPVGRAHPSRYLPASTGRLMATWVMHCLAVKLCTVFRWTLAARGLPLA